jgi:nitrous oxide reductase accessory protein NosL
VVRSAAVRVLAVALLLAGCAHHERTRHVYVPKSSGSCWRECKQIEATCNSKTTVYVGSEVVGVGGANDAVCADQRKDCLLSCPGAVEEWWVDGRPPTGKRKGEPDDPDE